MDTPVCHRLMAGHAASMVGSMCSPADDMTRIVAGSACIGSRCAMWVPSLGEDGDPADDGYGAFWLNPDDSESPNGRGWCADNLRRVPWADPAKAGAK